MENNQRMQSLIEQRETDIKSLIDKHRNEIEKAKEEAENVKKTHFDRDQEYRDMIIKLHEQKYEIEVLKGELDKEKKKHLHETNERKKLENELANMNTNCEYLKANINKLHRITHGKFKKVAEH